MDSKEVDNIIKKYGKTFHRKFTQDEFALFKGNAEKYFILYDSYKANKRKIGKEIIKRGLRKLLTDEQLSRIFLGIGCELILKSVYLKEGYLINVVNRNKFPKKMKKLHKPYKISEIPEKCVDEGHTEGINSLSNNLQHLLPKSFDRKLFDSNIRLGLAIAKIWRDKEAHIGGLYHAEDIHVKWIKHAIINIYEIFFDEKFSIF